LWVALAKEEKNLGLSITDAQIAELEENVSEIDFETVKIAEEKTRHEVMAHILAFGADCPTASEIIHLGATSSYVMDNGDLILMREGLDLLFQKMNILIEKLHHFCLHQADVPCMGFTHLQPAQPTTVGKRAAMWLQDFLDDGHELNNLLKNSPFLGVKGATGTQSSFLTLFDGNSEKVAALDSAVAKSFGFTKSYPIASQTYPRKYDGRVSADFLDQVTLISLFFHRF